MILDATAEVPEAQAPPEIEAGYARVRALLGTNFVPTVYRQLAVHPGAFAVALDRLAPIVALGRSSRFPERARSLARNAFPANAAVLDLSDARVSDVVERYRDANPFNLLFSLVISGSLTASPYRTMEPPLPAPNVDIWQDIQICHGGPVLPGLWRDLAPWPDDLERLWREVRVAADAGLILAARESLLLEARGLLSSAGMTPDLDEVLAFVPPQMAAAFAWFPVGVATMVAEGELLHQLTKAHTPREDSP